ncbi:MAG: ribbon-helix-helix domain-containing protein [Defluviitaleaceae bacterium]|nr:ribbon-helix-helix domain-containing protein [Defluviitaleaceae bacterium]
MAAKKKPGPHPENPKDTMLRIRVDKITLKKLDNTAEKTNSNRSEVVRQGIDLMDEKFRDQ